MQAEHIVIRPIRPEDDAPLSRIIRSNLEELHPTASQAIEETAAPEDVEAATTEK